MRKKLEQRLQKLKEEYENGKQQLAEIEMQASNIRNTLLRISGAIQVLEEELGQESGPIEGDINQDGILEKQKTKSEKSVGKSTD